MQTKWRTQMLRTRQLCRRWLGVLFCAPADDQQDKMKECSAVWVCRRFKILLQIVANFEAHVLYPWWGQISHHGCEITTQPLRFDQQWLEQWKTSRMLPKLWQRGHPFGRISRLSAAWKCHRSTWRDVLFLWVNTCCAKTARYGWYNGCWINVVMSVWSSTLES